MGILPQSTSGVLLNSHNLPKFKYFFLLKPNWYYTSPMFSTCCRSHLSPVQVIDGMKGKVFQNIHKVAIIARWSRHFRPL